MTFFILKKAKPQEGQQSNNSQEWGVIGACPRVQHEEAFGDV